MTELGRQHSRPDPSGFDPSRIPELVADMRSVADCDARAGEPLGKALRKGADAITHLFNALDRIANEEDVIADFDGFYLRDIARDAIWRGYAIATEARRAETTKIGSVHEGAGGEAVSPETHQGDSTK